MRFPKTFRHGGLTVDLHRDWRGAAPVQNSFLPSTAIVLLKQHAGAPSRCLVRRGEFVREGSVLGKPESTGAAQVHAPVPGVVRDLKRVRLPEGGECEAAVIVLEGSFDRLGKRVEKYVWKSMSRGDLLQTLRDRGVVEAEAPGRPLFELLQARDRPSLLVLNGVESEPYLRTEAAVLAERGAEVLEGLALLRKIVSPEETILALDSTDEATIARLRELAAEMGPQPEIRILEPRYPQDLENRLLEVLAKGRKRAAQAEEPKGKGAKEGGARESGSREGGAKEKSSGREKGAEALFVRPSTALAAYEAVVLAKPFVDRYVTVSGGAVKNPAVLKVRIGTPIGDLIEECGGFAGTPERLVIGGPFRGLPVHDLDAPITKQSSAVLALRPDETRKSRRQPCIRCGRCVDRCPERLDPAGLYRRVAAGRQAEAEALGLAACTSCGICGYACPSRLPLVEALAAARDKMEARR